MPKPRKPLAVVESRIEIHASPEVLWTCFTDLGKWMHWFPALVEARWVAGTPWTLGAQFRQSVRYGFPLGQLTLVAVVSEISPAPYVAWEGKMAGVEVTYGYRFDATANGTEVLSRCEFYGTPALLVRLFFARRMRRICRAALEGFKTYVETGTIQLKMPM